MNYLAYGMVGLCSGAFVGWGSYVSFVEPLLFDESGGTILADLLAAFLGAGIGAAGAIIFGWLIRSRRR